MGKDKASKGVFADYAPEYVSAGISIIPTGGESGKIPCENGYTRYVEKRPHSKTIERWVKGRPNANIGILAGPISNLTIVDVDDASIFDDAIARFGDTPIIAQTPSGGSHLYYRFNGEKGANHLEGMAIDIRAQGGPPLAFAQ